MTHVDLNEGLASALIQPILQGQILSGDALPSEIELAKKHALSRASVRSELRTLETLGIIERQAGRGTHVRDLRYWNILDPKVCHWITQYAHPDVGIVKDVFEFRRTVEPMIAATAAKLASARDLLAMEEAFSAMEANWNRHESQDAKDAFTTADIAFHEAIYFATHNLVWSQIVNVLRPAILLVIKTSNETADELRESLERHRRLMESIRMRDPDAAYDAAERILSQTGFDLGFQTNAGRKEIGST